MIPFVVYVIVVVPLLVGFGIVVVQRDRARQQVADLLAGVCTCTTPEVRCPSHPGAWQRAAN